MLFNMEFDSILKKKLKLYIYLIVNNMLLTWNLICALKLMRVYNLKLRF